MIAGVAADKRDLRARIRAARARRNDARAQGVLLRDAAAAAGLLDPGRVPGRIGPVVVAAYVASPGEPEVAAIREAIRAAGGTVLLPIPRPGRSLGWALDDGRYAPATRLRVLAPVGPEVGVGADCLVAHGVSLVLVPALAVDRSGTRLGQGGGYYDVLLAGLAGRVDALAVVRDDEVLPAGAIPREGHDAPIGGALTPSGVVRLGGGARG
jgi:5-formyltetrahydrofolate cyclo-ligase